MMDVSRNLQNPGTDPQLQATYGDIVEIVAKLPPLEEHTKSLSVFSPLSKRSQMIITRGLRPLLLFGGTAKTQKYARIDFVIRGLADKGILPKHTSASGLLDFFDFGVEDPVERPTYEDTVRSLNKTLDALRKQREKARKIGEFVPIQTTAEAASRLGQYCISLAASWEVEHPNIMQRGVGFDRVINSMNADSHRPLRACIGYALYTIYPRKT